MRIGIRNPPHFVVQTQWGDLKQATSLFRPPAVLAPARTQLSTPAGVVCPDPGIPISQWVRDHLAFTPDPAQCMLLDHPDDHRLIVCCTRQWGKSTILAAKAVHYALSNPECLVLIVASCLRQSKEFLRKLKHFARKVTRFRTEDGELYLANGSRIVPLPQTADTIRGYSAPQLIIIDEAAFVADSVFESLTPSLAVSNGALWLLSTPNGESGFFFEIWHYKLEGWTAFQVTAEQCDRIKPEFLARERLLKGEDTFNREYMCQFENSKGQLISMALLESRVSDHVQVRF